MTVQNIKARYGPPLRQFGLALAALLFFATPAFAERPDSDYAHGVADFEILVDMVDDTDDTDEQALERRIGRDLLLNSVHAEDERFFIVRALSKVDQQRIIQELTKDPRVEHVEENTRLRLIAPLGLGSPQASIMTPYTTSSVLEPVRKWVAGGDDPRRDEQWNLDMVHAETAWGWGSNGSGAVVAVIDTGVAYEKHDRFRQVEDLTNTEFVAGYDFVNDDEHANDDQGHGTHVAGTVAQSTDNGLGVAGLAPGATIMPIKVLSKEGWGTTADIADAIRFAADKGVNVINMSLGGGGYSNVLANAVAYAHKKGVFVACAAGNAGRGTVEYPAAYPGAFAVSSVGAKGMLARYSSYGKQIQLAAPGGDKQEGGEPGGILQNTIVVDDIQRVDFYGSFQGTSMATPHVAAAAALIAGAGITDPDAIAEILKTTANEPPTGKRRFAEPNKYGAGILDAGAAVQAARERNGGWRHLMASFLLLFWARRKQRSAQWQPLGVSGNALALLLPVGLFFVGYLGLGSIPGVSLLSASPIGAIQSAWWQSVLPPLLAVGLLLQVRSLQGAIIGICLAWAAFLGTSGMTLSYDLAWMPGFASGWDRSWLLLNAFFCLVLARQVSLPDLVKR